MSTHSHYHPIETSKMVYQYIGLLSLIIIAAAFRYYLQHYLSQRVMAFAWFHSTSLYAAAKPYFQQAQQWYQGKAWYQQNNQPGYSLFISGLWLFHIESISALRTVQTLIDSLNLIPLFIIMRKLKFDYRINLGTCFLYAILPPLAINASLLYSGAIIPTLLLWSLALSIPAHDSFTINNAIQIFVAGLVLGVAVLFNRYLFIFALLILCYQLFVYRNFYKVFVVITTLLGIICILFSWGAENHQRLHEQGINTPSRTMDVLQYSIMLPARHIDDAFDIWEEHPNKQSQLAFEQITKRVTNPLQLPLNQLPLPVTSRLFSQFGILIILLNLFFLRKAPHAFAVMILPLCFTLLALSIAPQFARLTPGMLLSYLLAAGLFLQSCHKHSQQHPGRHQRQFFALLVLLIAGLIAYELLDFLFVPDVL